MELIFMKAQNAQFILACIPSYGYIQNFSTKQFLHVMSDNLILHNLYFYHCTCICVVITLHVRPRKFINFTTGTVRDPCMHVAMHRQIVGQNSNL